MAKKPIETQMMMCGKCGKEIESYLLNDAGVCPGCALEKIKNVEKETRHGGARPGAGRPKLKNKKMVKSFTLDPETVETVSDLSKALDKSQSEIIRSAVSVLAKLALGKTMQLEFTSREKQNLFELSDRIDVSQETVIRMALYDMALDHEIEDGPHSSLLGPDHWK